MIFKKYLGLFVIIFTLIIGTTGIINVDASVGKAQEPCIFAHSPALNWLCPSPPVYDYPSKKVIKDWNVKHCKFVDANDKYYDCDGKNPYVNDP